MMELEIQESRAGGFGFNESLINLTCNSTIKGIDRVPKSPDVFTIPPASDSQMYQVEISFGFIEAIQHLNVG